MRKVFRGNNKKTIVRVDVSSHKPEGILETFRKYLESKLPSTKKSVIDHQINHQPSGIEINHIAIVLDGTVQDVVRAQNRLAALLLSGPEFVEFDPEIMYPTLGKTRLVDGVLVNTEEDHEEVN